MTATTTAGTERRVDDRRVGLAGAGQIARHHAEAVEAVPGVRLVGVTDVDRARAAALAERHGIAVFDDLAAMVAAGVDVVHVLTPPHAHGEVAEAAMLAGCDVLVEKPLAGDLATAERLCTIAQQTGRRAGVDHSLLADPGVRRVLDAVRAGGVGDVVAAEYFCSSAYPPWESGPRPPHYRDGGYPFRDLGVHGLYLLRASLGEIESVRVDFRGGGRDPNLCFDEWRALVRCARGTGVIQLSWNVEPWQTIFSVHGTRGSLRADVGLGVSTRRSAPPGPAAVGRALNLLQDALPSLWAVPRNGARVLAGRLRPYAGLRAFVAEFYTALATGAPLPASLEDGRDVVRWLETAARPADRAARQRRTRARAVAAQAPVVVTGGTGLVGRRLVDALLASGVPVRVLARRPPPARTDGGVLDVVVGDLGDAREVARAVRGASAVFHVGAAMQGSSAEHARGTVAGTRHVIDACLSHQVPKLVHVSSLSVLDWRALDGRVVTETAPLEPHPEWRGAYTAAKLAAERAVGAAVAADGLRAIILRPGAIVDPAASLTRVLDGVRLGRRFVMFGAASRPLPIVHVDDVVAGLLAAARMGPADGTIVHLVEECVPQAELATALSAREGVRVVRMPAAALRLAAVGLDGLFRLAGRHAPLRPYRVDAASARLRFDCAKAREVLDWHPRGDVRALCGAASTAAAAGEPEPGLVPARGEEAMVP